MAKLELLSRTVYDADGVSTSWDFNFAGGYLLPEHVKAYYEQSNVRTQIVVTPAMLIGPNQLYIAPPVPAGSLLTIYRDTPKDAPLVDFVDRGTVSEVALDTIAKQAVFVAAEAQDSAAVGTTDVAVNAATAAQVQALLASGFASAASTSATNAATSATNAATSATNAASAAATAVNSHKAELLAAGGSALVGHAPAGVGAVPTTTQAKLRALVTRAEYDTAGNFDTAKTGKPSIDGSGNFDAPVSPLNGPGQTSLAQALLHVPGGPRDAILYNNATSVKVTRSHAVMGGFRFRGQYSKGQAPLFPMPASKVASVSTGLGAESAVRTENWYAVFACANAGDAAATLKVMPFLRAGTVSGSTVPLIKAGEGVHALTAQTYAWSAANNLNGVECLAITEGGMFSGRVTTITANTAGQVTLGTVGGVAANDFLLPAPPGFSQFVYLGSFYFDTAEVRNIADAGIVVKAKMVQLTDPNFTASGTIASAVQLRFGGYICPLATGVVLKDTHTISTASTGSHAGYFWSDSSNHEIHSNYEEKVGASSSTFVWDGIELPFAQWQSVWYLTGGSLAASRAGATLEIKGWLEP